MFGGLVSTPEIQEVPAVESAASLKSKIMEAQLENIHADTDLKKQQLKILEVDLIMKKAQLAKFEEENYMINPVDMIRDITRKYNL